LHNKRKEKTLKNRKLYAGQTLSFSDLVYSLNLFVSCEIVSCERQQVVSEPEIELDPWRDHANPGRRRVHRPPRPLVPLDVIPLVPQFAVVAVQ
jgi:hypothetical protein